MKLEVKTQSQPQFPWLRTIFWRTIVSSRLTFWAWQTSQVWPPYMKRITSHWRACGWQQPSGSWAWCSLGRAGLLVMIIWEYENFQYHHKMYRSLHGGLSHDGREDESYPLQPYYWLAIDLPCTRKYDHLNEEQAWHRDCSMKGTLRIMYCVEIKIVQNIREPVKNYSADLKIKKF